MPIELVAPIGPSKQQVLDLSTWEQLVECVVDVVATVHGVSACIDSLPLGRIVAPLREEIIIMHTIKMGIEDVLWDERFQLLVPNSAVEIGWFNGQWIVAPWCKRRV